MSTIAIQSLTIKKLLIALAVCFAFYLSVFNTTADAAAPVVQSITPTSFASSTTSHNVNIPAASAGDIILVLIGFDVNYSITTPNGWTQLFTVANGGWSSMAAYYKPIVGDASATTVDFVSSTNTTMGAQAYRITGGNTLSAGTPVVYGSLVNQPDPPSLSPGWGVVDTLWIAVANQNQSSTITSVPTNYANGTTTNGAAGGIIHSARRSTTASSENPGVWTFSGSWESLANTIAVYNANTAPSITSGPSSAYIGSGTTRTGPNNAWQLIFNATDAEQTGSNALTFYLHTGANRTGTQVCSATFTSGGGVGYSGCAYNAPGMVVGTNTLYLSVYDGTNYAATNPTVTVLRDDTAPTASTTISTTPSPVTGNYTVTFTPNDATSTGANEMSYQIRTAAAGGGTLLTSGTANSTSGSPKTTGSITTDTLSQGSNTRYIRACDGASNCTDTSFTVTGALPPTSVTAVAYDPPALYSFKNTLKGSANPNGSPARGHFRLYTSAPDCTQDTNGTRVPSSAGNDPVLGSGSSPVAFSYTTTVPLTRQTPYWYCAYSDNNAAGTGTPGTAAAAGYQTFTTPDGPAGGCDPATSGDLTITDACTFPATDFDGVDSGGNTNTNTARITLGAGGNVTILAGQKVARGSISFSGGLLTLQNGNGGIIRGGVYLLDADGDGYIDNNTSRYVGVNPPAGYVRRNYLASTTYSGANYNYASKMYAVSTFDCNTSSQIEGVNVTNLAVDADQDGYYTGATGTSCVGGTTTVSGRTYYRVADGSYSKIIGNPTGGANAIAANDCQDNPNGKPCAPVSTSASNPSSQTQNDISWAVDSNGGSVPAATASALQWCSGSGSCTPTSLINGVTSIYNHTGLTAGTTYGYQVLRQNAAGNSSASNKSYVATQPSCTNTTVYSDNDLDGHGNNGPDYKHGLTTKASISSGTTLTINKPADIQNGMFMIAVVEHEGGSNRTVSAPAGGGTWTLVRSTYNGTNVGLDVWYKYANNEGASYAFTLSSSTGASQGFITSFSNVATSAPIRSNGSFNTVSDASVAYTAGDLYLVVGGSNASSTSKVYYSSPVFGDELFNHYFIQYASNDSMAGAYRKYSGNKGTIWAQFNQSSPGGTTVIGINMSIKPLVQTTQVQCLTGAPSSGWSTDNTDCDDTTSAYYQVNSSGYPDIDSDGTNPTFSASICSGVSLRTGVSASSGTDCAQSGQIGETNNYDDGAKWQNITGYSDADNDTYTVGGSQSVCSGAALPYGYRASASGTADCYDLNANAFPGQTAYFSTPTGSGLNGGYDYDCNSSSVKETYDKCTGYFFSGWVLSGGCSSGGSLLMCGTHSVQTPTDACGQSVASNNGFYVGTGVYWKDAACSSQPESQVGAYTVACH